MMHRQNTREPELFRLTMTLYPHEYRSKGNEGVMMATGRRVRRVEVPA